MSLLIQWGPGLGVKQASEFIAGTPYVPFYVDNEDHYDFMLFVFSQKVDINQVQISPSGNTFDLDVSFWLGNVDASFNLNGEAFSDLPIAGFGTRADNNWTPTVPIPEPSSAGMLAFGVVSLLIRRRR